MASDPRALEFECGGLRLRGLAWSGTGLPTLLVHATSFCAATWRPVWEAAQAAGWLGPAVAFDQRGHGGSDAPKDAASYGWERLADDVSAVADALRDQSGSQQILLAGHSSGATCALAVAGRQPDHVAGLILVEPVLYDPPGETGADSFAGSRVLAERTRQRRWQFPDRAAARAKLADRFPYSRFAPESLAAFLEGWLVELAGESDSTRLCCEPEREAWVYEGADGFDVWPWVEKVRAPVLLIVGEHSAVPDALRRRLLERVANSRVETVPGASHFAALEAPRAVGEQLARFAATCAA